MATSSPAFDPAALDDSDDDFNYQEVEVISDDEDDISEDLDAALRNLQAFTKRETGVSRPKTEDQPLGSVQRKPELMEDFLRNFFVKMGFSRTCETFEAEWYELKETGRLDGSNALVPDVYLKNCELEEEINLLRRELQEAKSIASKASATWDKFRKERDFHRMHHKRVAQEKNKLILDIKRLKEHYAKYDPIILELKRKYETVMKEKMLFALDRDKLQAKVDHLEAQVKANQMESKSQTLPRDKDGKATTLPGAAKRSGWASLSLPPRANPVDGLDFPAAPVRGFSLQKTFKGHLLSVSNLALHPSKPILITASDDKTWKMWHLPAGDLIMCGEGHKDWVSGIDVHPTGLHLASGSGDNTVKVWDFKGEKCTQTLTNHQQAVWGVRWHDLGDVLASCSLDHTVRLWDVPAGKCQTTLRGHVDSVNDLAWQPCSSNLCTASSDKTVSVWDARSGLCTQTFYGHHNSCSCASFNMQATMVVSTDADGVVKLWDVRMVAEIMSIDAGKHPANKCSFDRSGVVIAVASDDGRVKCFSTSNGEPLTDLTGHEDAVQATIFDPAGQYLVSCGSDNTFRLWA